MDDKSILEVKYPEGYDSPIWSDCLIVFNHFESNQQKHVGADVNILNFIFSRY